MHSVHVPHCFDLLCCIPMAIMGLKPHKLQMSISVFCSVLDENFSLLQQLTLLLEFICGVG